MDKDGKVITDSSGKFIDLSAEDKQKLRNQISAQRSRSNKKMEMAGLAD